MSPLQQVQQSLAAELARDAFFTDADPEKSIEVLTQMKGDLQSAIAQKISSLGISVVVITPLGKLSEPVVDALNFNAPLVVQITEDPTLNNTGKSALDVVCEVMCLGHGMWTGLGNPRVNRLYLTETPFSLVDESPTYHVNFVAPITLTPRRAQSAIPGS